MDDSFWSVEKWPPYMLSVLFCDSFQRQERLVLATFLHGNGMNSNILAERLFKFYNPHWNMARIWSKKIFEFTDLWKYLDKANDVRDSESSRIRTQYYFYSMRANHMMFYDGYLRGNGGKRIAYIPSYQ